MQFKLGSERRRQLQKPRSHFFAYFFPTALLYNIVDKEPVQLVEYSQIFYGIKKRTCPGRMIPDCVVVSPGKSSVAIITNV
jgi:hypothetical protein